MTLEAEIKKGALQIATDAYEMSIGELMNVYRDGELFVSPEFQRLFRWDEYQKSHLIESLLIGVPIPSIFVFELEDGKWELIDGLQRVSTILQFAGILRTAGGKLYPPFVCDGTRYLPSLANVSWEGKPDGTNPIGLSQQIAIKRARLSIQILKKTSDEKAKYDLFQRLNSHGSTATPQELRNCTVYMLNKSTFRKLKEMASDKKFSEVMQPSDRGSSTQALLDYLTRFLVFLYIDYQKRWDIEEYLNTGIIEIAESPDQEIDEMLSAFRTTIDLISKTGESDILKRFKDGRFQGRVGQAAFEVIFMGVAQNLEHVAAKTDPGKFILSQAKALWTRKDVLEFTRAGLRGTDRIKKTIDFGREWFAA